MVLDFLAIHPMPIAEQASAATPKGSAGKPRSNEWPAEVATPLLDVAKLPLDASSLADTTMQDCNEHLEAVPEGCVVKNKFLGPSGGPQQDVMLLPGLPTGAQTVTPRSLSAPVANMQTHCDDPDCLTVLRTSILEEAGAATPQGSAGELQPNEWPAEVATSRWDVRRQLLDAAPPTSAHDTQDSGEHEFRVVAQRSDTGVPPLILTGTTTPEAGAGESAGEAAVGKAGQAAGGESRSAECGPCRYAWKPGDYRNSNDLEYSEEERHRYLFVSPSMSPMKVVMESPPKSFGSSVAGSRHWAEDQRATLDRPKKIHLHGTEEKMLRHESGECQPCAYYYQKIDGCRKGAGCDFCHLCPKGELRKRKREAVKKLKRER